MKLENGTEAIFEEILTEKLPDPMKDTKFRKPDPDSYAGQIKRSLETGNGGGGEGAGGMEQRQMEYLKAIAEVGKEKTSL